MMMEEPITITIPGRLHINLWKAYNEAGWPYGRHPEGFRRWLAERVAEMLARQVEEWAAAAAEEDSAVPG